MNTWAQLANERDRLFREALGIPANFAPRWHNCPPGLDARLWMQAVREVCELLGEQVPNPDPPPPIAIMR